MKSKIRSTVLLFLALGLVVCLPVATGQFRGSDDERWSPYGLIPPDPDVQMATDNFGFGMRIAGTYFSHAGFGGTLTLHADGTVVALSGQCCGNAPNIQSESYGNWVRTAPNQIELRTVAIGTSHDFLGGGPLGNFVATPSEVLDFADDYQSFTGALCTAVWFYDLGVGTMPDVEADAPDLVVGPFPVAMSRLAVFVECPE